VLKLWLNDSENYVNLNKSLIEISKQRWTRAREECD